MATIKSYSDLQQSKKLSEILPLESADMSWVSNGLGRPFARTIPIKGDPEELCMCWSLAALLDVLPEGWSSVLTKSFNGEDYYCKLDGEPIETMADNPIDACVAMIEKLHELNLL